MGATAFIIQCGEEGSQVNIKVMSIIEEKCKEKGARTQLTSVGDDLETKEKVVKQAPVQSAPAKKETLVKIKQELETLLELLRK